VKQMELKTEDLIFSLENTLKVELMKLPPKIKDMKMSDFLSDTTIPSTVKKTVHALGAANTQLSATPLSSKKRIDLSKMRPDARLEILKMFEENARIIREYQGKA
jgi:hypothetical protein